MDFRGLEERINYVFKDKELLERAMTLPSVVGAKNNQTLEFFGDAVLEFIVSERIYEPEASEGELTEKRKAIVSDKALEPISRKLKLDEYLVRTSGDRDNKKAVPSAYEALCAAIYLDGGIDAVKKFAYSTLDFTLSGGEENYKGNLQEWLQDKGLPLPEYECRNTGTPQSPQFTATVEVMGKKYRGVAGSKQQAEKNAARAALRGAGKK